MAKSLLYRLFGVGKIPEPLRSQLQTEGIDLLDEAVKGSVTYRDFRAPGKRDSWRRQWYVASIALTKIRVIIYLTNHPIRGMMTQAGYCPIWRSISQCLRRTGSGVNVWWWRESLFSGASWDIMG
jgi:hypothetical protein